MNVQKKEKWNITFSMRFRFLATVIFAMIAIAVFVGGLSIYEVDRYVENQAETFVDAICANEGSQINDSLRNMEKSVKIMESYLMDFYTSKADIADTAVQEKVIKSADQMFVDVAKHTSTNGAISYYFRLDPAVSHSKAGLFYSKMKGSEEFISFDVTDLDLYEKDDTEHVGWFWQPYEAGEPIWMKPYYNQNNNFWMISYVIPMYFEGSFIGIVGMDFDYEVLSAKIHDIEIYENGFAHLESDGAVICSDDDDLPGDDHANSGKYMRTSRALVNGMTLVLSACYDDIRQIRHDIAGKILLTVAVLLAVFIAIAVVVVQKRVDPLKKITDASVKLSMGDYDVQLGESNTQEIKLLSAAFENMTARLREREELLHLSANRDSMTGLRNTTSYTSWMEKFDQEIDGKNARFGVIMLDLNDLKKTNDQYGHDVGNELIVIAAKIISDIFKRSPVFRIGGDEFLVVLQNSDLENREKLMAQFDRDCANTFIEKEGARIPISVASGYAVFDPDQDRRFADVFKRADEAMYKNKSMSKLLSV